MPIDCFQLARIPLPQHQPLPSTDIDRSGKHLIGPSTKNGLLPLPPEIIAPSTNSCPVPIASGCSVVVPYLAKNAEGEGVSRTNKCCEMGHGTPCVCAEKISGTISLVYTSRKNSPGAVERQMPPLRCKKCSRYHDTDCYVVCMCAVDTAKFMVLTPGFDRAGQAVEVRQVVDSP